MNAMVHLTYSSTISTATRFDELDLVRTKKASETDDGVPVPAGSVGAIVATWAEGAAFEVEFAGAAAGLATIAVEDLELVSSAE